MYRAGRKLIVLLAVCFLFFTGNAFACVGTGCEAVAFRQCIITNKLFNSVNTDVIFHFVTVTTVFTRRRADPTHDRREGVCIG